MKSYMTIKTAAGYCGIIYEDDLLLRLVLPLENSTKCEQELIANMEYPITQYSHAPYNISQRLKDYFAGKPDDFTDILVNMSGYTNFQKAVLEESRRTHWGDRTSYGELAKAAGYPGAARAAGNALGRNATPIVIPCHRVIESNGAIGGFSMGIDWKKRLLLTESSLTHSEVSL